MTNLCFDVNNIFMRSMFVISNYGAKKYSFDNQSELDQLVRKMAMDISYITRQINPTHIMFALDSRSWRKDIEITENDGYKANRIKSKFINWDNVYKTIDDFVDILQAQNIVVSRIDNAESDDILCLYAHELMYNRNQHVIIVSGDEDLRQLVKSHRLSNDKIVYTTVFNPFLQGKNATRKLYVPANFETWINTADEVDFMHVSNTIDLDKADFKRIITNEKTKVEFVNGNMIALRKIFCGDDSDNVPAFHTWISKNKDGKDEEKRITNSKFEKIYEMLQENPSEQLTYNDLLNRVDKLKDIIEKVIKQDISFDVLTRLERQIKLVVLDPKFFPKDIVKKFEETKNENLEKPRTNYTNLNMQSLLSGTKYVDENRSRAESNIFKDIDSIPNHKLF